MIQKAHSSEIALNWLGASTNCFWTSFASWRTATKSPTLKPKLMVLLNTRENRLRRHVVKKRLKRGHLARIAGSSALSLHKAEFCARQIEAWRVATSGGSVRHEFSQFLLLAQFSRPSKPQSQIFIPCIYISIK